MEADKRIARRVNHKDFQENSKIRECIGGKEALSECVNPALRLLLRQIVLP